MKKVLSTTIVVLLFVTTLFAQDEPLQRSQDMGNGVTYEIRGHEGDLIWFSIHGAIIGRDNVKDNPICCESYRVNGNTYIVVIIDGREKDLVYAYAITGNTVLRSPRWRDQTPGVLNLSGVSWSGTNTFSIDGRGTMSYSNGQWSCTAGAGAVIQGSQTVINSDVLVKPVKAEIDHDHHGKD